MAGCDAAGVPRLVAAALDEVAQPVEGAIHRHAHLRVLRIGMTGTTLCASMALRTLSETWPRYASGTLGSGWLSAMTGSKPR